MLSAVVLPIEIFFEKLDGVGFYEGHMIQRVMSSDPFHQFVEDLASVSERREFLYRPFSKCAVNERKIFQVLDVVMPALRKYAFGR
jgi:hypothetical protein